MVKIITLICLFIVKKKRIKKYMTRIGQNTGTLKQSKKVVNVARIDDIITCSLKQR